MADLIENGFFEANDFSPWEHCDCPEVGEPWICLDEEEPGFDRYHWICTRGGVLTSMNWVFLTDYNLKLTDNDCVKQILAGDVRAGGDFSLWAHCTPLDMASGELYAFVCYRDQTFNFGRLTRDQLRGFVGPTKLNIEVRDKIITKVVIGVIDALASWYITGISLPGVEAKALRQPNRPGFFIENRVALLENKVDHLFRIIAKGVPGQKVDPDSEGKGKEKKGEKKA